MLDLRITDVTPVCAQTHRFKTLDRSTNLGNTRTFPRLPPALTSRGRRLTYRLAAKQQYLAGVTLAYWNSTSGTAAV